MDEFPTELPATGTTFGPINYHGTEYLFRGIADGVWLIDGPSGIQSEIRQNEDGGFSFMRTDGKTQHDGEGDSWSEIVAEFF